MTIVEMLKCPTCGLRWDSESIKDGEHCRECESNHHWEMVVQLEHDCETARDEAREFLGDGAMPAGLKYVVQVLVARLREQDRRKN